MHNHEPPVARIQEPRDGRFHRWPAVWSAALAQPRAGSAYIHRGSRDVLAVRSRAQHSSAGAGPSSSWRSCLVGVSSRLASLDACRARLLRLRPEVRNSRLADLSSNAGNWSTIYTRFTQRPPLCCHSFFPHSRNEASTPRALPALQQIFFHLVPGPSHYAQLTFRAER